jgi:GNAT superfamily N-acetyltransferase
LNVFRIEEVDYSEMPDDELTPVLARANQLTREMLERSVDRSLDEFRLLTKSPGSVQRRLLVRDGREGVVGFAETRYADDGSNPDVLRCQIRVVPGHRRLGIGTMLLGQVARIAQDLGRTRLLGLHFDTVPSGAAFAIAIGAEEKLQFHENVLRMADLDEGLMRQWAAKNPSGYTIRIVDGPYPDELLDGVAHLYYVLERDMPISDGTEPRRWTAELVAEMMEHYLQGTEALTALAIHDGGMPVGLSQLVRLASDTTTWLVTTTMVDPPHRGKSIGKWMKGSVNLAALDGWPGAIYQETGNAFVNEAMLAINHAMGFEHEMTTTDVEVGVTDALAYVAAKGRL